MKNSLLLCLLLIGLASPRMVRSQLAPPTTAVRGLDPVALSEGKEMPGKEDLTVVRGRYRYQFADPESRQRFENAPEQYSIQMGGACARMGPLSGGGRADRYYVHEGRIYLFASEQCREAFKANPEKFIDTADGPVEGTEAEKKRGLDLLKLALDGLGGAGKVDGLTNYQAVITVSYRQRDNVTEGKRTLTIVFPGRHREEENWGASSSGHALVLDDGFQFGSGTSWRMDPSVRTYMAREHYHEPLALLKARREPGFRAVATGRGQVEGTEVEFLKMSLAGATTTLAIDPKDGRILQAAYRSRVNGPVGDVEKNFSDFRPVDGLRLPFKVQTRFNDRPVANPSLEYESVKLNGRIDSTLFKLPD